jgi:hypothetical protein
LSAPREEWYCRSVPIFTAEGSHLGVGSELAGNLSHPVVSLELVQLLAGRRARRLEEIASASA